MDNRHKLDAKLTPAAEQALGELVDDYRQQVLIGAAESAESLGDLREISVHDIVAGMRKQQTRVLGPTRSHLERLMRLYMYSGILVGGLSLVTYIVMQLLTGRSLTQQLPLVGAVTGLSFAAVAYFVLWTRKNRSDVLLRRSLSDFEPEEYGRFLSLWRDLEVAIRRAAAVRLGESEAAGSISTLLEQVARTGILTVEDQDLLRRLLAFRNSMVHGGSVDIDRSSAREAVREGARLLERLRAVS